MVSSKNGRVLYHGTDSKFRIPDPKYFKDIKDFGTGFYLTTSADQAERFARLRSRSTRRTKGYVNMYWLSDNALANLNVANIKDSVIWLRYVLFCRGYNTNDLEIEKMFSGYDIICGKVADAKVNDILSKYMHKEYHSLAKGFGMSPEEIAVKELKVEVFEDQIVFKTQKALDSLSFIKAKVVQ